MIVSKYGFLICYPTAIRPLIRAGWRRRSSAASDFRSRHDYFATACRAGLTTAAGIWATSGIGLTIRAGMYVIGISGTILALIGLELLNFLFKPAAHSLSVSFRIEEKAVMHDILTSLEEKGILITSYELNKAVLEVKGRVKSKSGKAAVMEKVQALPYILSVKVE